ncbi:MAG: hypothetical protein ABDI20_02895, partial [Candidatus Bipolaricaulaceae bacterium]
MAKALALLREGPRTLLETYDLRDLGMLCGGRTTLFYEVLQAPPTLAISAPATWGSFSPPGPRGHALAHPPCGRPARAPSGPPLGGGGPPRPRLP